MRCPQNHKAKKCEQPHSCIIFFFITITFKNAKNQPFQKAIWANGPTLTPPGSCGFTVMYRPVEGRWPSFTSPGDATTKAAMADGGG